MKKNNPGCPCCGNETCGCCLDFTGPIVCSFAFEDQTPSYDGITFYNPGPDITIEYDPTTYGYGPYPADRPTCMILRGIDPPCSYHYQCRYGGYNANWAGSAPTGIYNSWAECERISDDCAIGLGDTAYAVIRAIWIYCDPDETDPCQKYWATLHISRNAGTECWFWGTAKAKASCTLDPLFLEFEWQFNDSPYVPDFCTDPPSPGNGECCPCQARIIMTVTAP